MTEHEVRQAYLEGFSVKCAEYGVNPEVLAELAFGKDAQWGKLWNQAKQTASNAVQGAKNWVGGAVSGAADKVLGAGEAIGQAGQQMAGNIGNTVNEAAGLAKDVTNAATSGVGVKGMQGRLLGQQVGNAVNQGAKAVGNVVNQGAKAVGNAVNQGIQSGREVVQGTQAAGQEVAGGVRNVMNTFNQGAQNVANARGAALNVPR